MPDYTYQFDDSVMSRFSENFENRLGDNSGYHEQEHFDNLHMLFKMNHNGSMLDVGAGMGRISIMAKDIVSEVVALEPDESRWADCHKACHSEPDCLVFCQTTGEYIEKNPDKRFDLIIVSMVLQHLATKNCQQLVSDVYKLLDRDGVAVFYTTHTLEKSKGYSFSGDNTRAFVPESEFNQYADTHPSEQKMGLPVRRFSRQELIATVEAEDLEPIYWRQTSYYKPTKVGFFAARLKVDREELLSVGNSQFVVVTKKI
jgi:ubiquinone/menaquinone biosynthesis C-methylase UbiE